MNSQSNLLECAIIDFKICNFRLEQLVSWNQILSNYLSIFLSTFIMSLGTRHLMNQLQTNLALYIHTKCPISYTLSNQLLQRSKK